jgi:hypothetical protein
MRYIVCLTGMFLVLVCTSVVVAQVPGLSGDPSKTPGIIEYYTNGNIGSEDNPIGVYLDPNAGPWIKNFLGVNGGLFNINEWVAIVGDPNYPNPPGPPWTDWDEQIMTPGWIWAANPAPNADVYTWDAINMRWVLKKSVAEAANSTNTFVEFDFIPPESPNELLNITKTLVWSGPGSAPVNATIVVWQWPTPEPGTIALLATGLLALGLGRVWRRK